MGFASTTLPSVIVLPENTLNVEERKKNARSLSNLLDTQLDRKILIFYWLYDFMSDLSMFYDSSKFS